MEIKWNLQNCQLSWKNILQDNLGCNNLGCWFKAYSLEFLPCMVHSSITCTDHFEHPARYSSTIEATALHLSQTASRQVSFDVTTGVNIFDLWYWTLTRRNKLANTISLMIRRLGFFCLLLVSFLWSYKNVDCSLSFFFVVWFMMTKPDVYIYVCTLCSLYKFCQFSIMQPCNFANSLSSTPACKSAGIQLRLFAKFPRLNFQGNVLGKFMEIYQQFSEQIMSRQMHLVPLVSLSVVACITLKALCCWCTALPKEPQHPPHPRLKALTIVMALALTAVCPLAVSGGSDLLTLGGPHCLFHLCEAR